MPIRLRRPLSSSSAYGQVSAAVAHDQICRRRLQTVLRFEPRLPQADQLMLESFKIDNHGSHPRGRCHIEMVAMSTEASMTVTMNVRPKRIPV